MSVDPVRAADTKAWLLKAGYDLRAARLELTAKPPLWADIVFHAQQLAEKSMKAFLTWHDRPFRKTHDIGEIGKACTEIDPSLEAALRPAASLTQYAWKYRYPGDADEPAPEEAEEALVLARAVQEAILSRLPAEVHP